MRPIIAITVNYSYNGSSESMEGIGTDDQQWQLLADDYITAVERAGGLPLMLPVFKGDDRDGLIKEAVSLADGILFSGGTDLDLALFGGSSDGHTGIVVPERDRAEIALAEYVIQKTDKPVMGVCRGIQLINAVLGGSLIPHIPDSGRASHSFSAYPKYLPAHHVSVDRDSLLYRLTGCEDLSVNSFHHMAVGTCAPVLRPVAVTQDGLIEAVELKDNPNHRFLLAVQWHPEMMSEADPVQQRIITGFVNQCRKQE